jgi:Spy/CpxP family protein refolding chaperone
MTVKRVPYVSTEFAARLAIKIAVGLALILMLGPSEAFAQGRRGGGGGGGGRGGFRGGPPQVSEESSLQLLTAVLSLDDMQQQQLRTAFDAAAKTAAPIATQLEDDKNALFAAVKAGKGDDEIKSLAEQQGALTSQILKLQAQTFAKLWAILRNDQKAEMDDLLYANIGEFLANAKQPVPEPAAPATSDTAGAATK